ncbi:fluoride efflux transporter CrcB [Halobacteriales archaeon QS_8_69_26]|nr:MAG: fluoride efflux transporter CrcB [Halobacteriales archaeon QS_8_69_26]
MPPLPPAHLVGIGGAVGAVLRHLLAQRVDREAFPVGTLVVNVLGSFALGVVVGTSLDDRAVLLFGTGVCGSFTTYSSFSYETVRRWESGERARAALNAVGNLALATLGLTLGVTLARTLS